MFLRMKRPLSPSIQGTFLYKSFWLYLPPLHIFLWLIFNIKHWGCATNKHQGAASFACQFLQCLPPYFTRFLNRGLKKKDWSLNKNPGIHINIEGLYQTLSTRATDNKNICQKKETTIYRRRYRKDVLRTKWQALTITIVSYSHDIKLIILYSWYQADCPIVKTLSALSYSHDIRNIIL